MRCAIYCRVSTDNQKEKQTIASQLRVLPEYAESQGWEPRGKPYVDDGLSGETVAGRPEFFRLMEDAKKGLFDVVLVTDLDRISRSSNQIERGYIFENFKEHNIKIATPATGIFDPHNEIDEVIVSIFQIFSAFEKQKILSRFNNGRIEALKQGRYVGNNLPYGYRWNRKHKKFEVVNEEADVVREIFRLCNEENKGSRKIADRITEMGIPTQTMIAFQNKKKHLEGKKSRKVPTGRWNSVVIDSMLQNTAYYGEMITNRWKGREKEVEKPKEKWIKIKVTPIINRQTWELAQERRQKRKKYVCRQSKHPYLCNGLLFCVCCGNRMAGRTVKSSAAGGGQDYSYYICYGRDKRFAGEGEKCKMPHYRVDNVDEVVWQEISRLIKNPTLIEEVAGRLEEETELTPDDLKKLELKEDKLNLEQESVIRLYRKGTIREDQLDVQIKEIKSEVERLKEKKDRVLAAINGRNLKAERLYSVQAQVAELSSRVDTLSFEERRQVVEAIIVGDGEHRIELGFDGTMTIKGIFDFEKYNGNSACEVRQSGSIQRGFTISMCHLIKLSNFRLGICMKEIARHQKG